MIGPIAIASVLLVLAFLIGMAFGESTERENHQDRLARTHAEHTEALKDLQVRLDAVAATSRLVITMRDMEISELKSALAAEKRARSADLGLIQPAGWGEVETDPSAQTTDAPSQQTT